MRGSRRSFQVALGLSAPLAWSRRRFLPFAGGKIAAHRNLPIVPAIPGRCLHWLFLGLQCAGHSVRRVSCEAWSQLDCAVRDDERSRRVCLVTSTGGSRCRSFGNLVALRSRVPPQAIPRDTNALVGCCGGIPCTAGQGLQSSATFSTALVYARICHAHVTVDVFVHGVCHPSKVLDAFCLAASWAPSLVGDLPLNDAPWCCLPSSSSQSGIVAVHSQELPSSVGWTANSQCPNLACSAAA